MKDTASEKVKNEIKESIYSMNRMHNQDVLDRDFDSYRASDLKKR